MPFDPTKPYNDLPLLPPKADIETKAILKACITARDAIGRLNEAARSLPNGSILINTIPVLEAQASSAIENIVTTTDALFRHAQTDDDHADPATKETLRYRTALRAGFESLKTKTLSTNTAIDICHAIKGADIGLRRTPGVALKNVTTGEVVYTPPEGETRIRDLMANWEQFIHADNGLDPLIVMAVQHYQFEAIHPFADGNGRTGRILNGLVLVEKKLLDLPLLYLSRFIVGDRATYYDLLKDLTRTGNFGLWIEWILMGTTITALETRSRIVCIKQLMSLTSDQCQQRAPRIHSNELMSVIFSQPYCRIGDLVRAGIGQRQTASDYLKKLCEIDVLKEVKVGREKIFLNQRLFETLTLDPPDFDLFERPSDNAFRFLRYLEKYPRLKGTGQTA